MPNPKELFDNFGDSNIFTIVNLRQGSQPDYACCEGSQENDIPWKQQVMGMACGAFWIEKCTCLLSANHGLGSRKGRFIEVLHR
jgi:hypothetical protein